MIRFIRRPTADPAHQRFGGLGIVVFALGIALVAAILFIARQDVPVLAEVEALVARTGGSGQATLQSGAASGQLTIWAKLPIQAPECDCHTPPLARVYSTLKDEHLDGGLTDEGSVGSWQYLSLTFDPRQVSRQHILDLIATDGGVILPGRPAGLPTATVASHA